MTITPVQTADVHSEDQVLVRAVLDGSAEARDRFCARVRCVGRILSVRNLDLGRPLDEHELADVAQEVTLAVWRRLRDYSGRASLETWVYKFCTLTLMGTLRRRRSAESIRAQIPAIDPAGAEPAEARSSSDGAGIEGLLRHLSPRESEVIRLRHVDELGNAEISEVLGISVNSVKTHSLNGMRKLRSLLADRDTRGTDAR